MLACILLCYPVPPSSSECTEQKKSCCRPFGGCCFGQNVKSAAGNNPLVHSIVTSFKVPHATVDDCIKLGPPNSRQFHHYFSSCDRLFVEWGIPLHLEKLEGPCQPPRWGFDVLRCGTSRDPNMIVLLHHLSLIAAQHSFSFIASPLAGILNQVADDFYCFLKFHHLAPKASLEATPISGSLMEDL